MMKGKTKDTSEKALEENHMESWTTSEKETCKSRYGCEILIENGSYSEVSTSEVPSDAYIVKYMLDNKICFDLTRGTKTKLFDMYWDKFRDNLKSIEYGCGKYNPKIWGYKAPGKKKRK